MGSQGEGVLCSALGPARSPPTAYFSCVKITPVSPGAPDSCLLQQLNSFDSLKTSSEV